VIDDRIWPTGIEYQLRFNDKTGRNHTGDLIRPATVLCDWYASEDGKSYLNPKDGGKLYTGKGWIHLAAPTEKFHGLDDEWNQCEIIVMGSEYAIHKLNGKVVNMAFNLNPSEGIIGLQSETAEIFYRNIQIKEFDEVIPTESFLK
jgi:hypothetical protein